MSDINCDVDMAADEFFLTVSRVAQPDEFIYRHEILNNNRSTGCITLTNEGRVLIQFQFEGVNAARGISFVGPMPPDSSMEVPTEPRTIHVRLNAGSENVQPLAISVVGQTSEDNAAEANYFVNCVRATLRQMLMGSEVNYEIYSTCSTEAAAPAASCAAAMPTSGGADANASTNQASASPQDQYRGIMARCISGEGGEEEPRDGELDFPRALNLPQQFIPQTGETLRTYYNMKVPRHFNRNQSLHVCVYTGQPHTFEEICYVYTSERGIALYECDRCSMIVRYAFKLEATS